MGAGQLNEIEFHNWFLGQIRGRSEAIPLC